MRKCSSQNDNENGDEITMEFPEEEEGQHNVEEDEYPDSFESRILYNNY